MQSDPLSQRIKKMFPSQATAIANHYYVHKAVNKNQKYLKSIRNSLKRSKKENGKVSKRITCDFSNTAHTI